MSSRLFSVGGVPSSCEDSTEIISTPSSLRLAVIEEVDSEGVSTPSFTSFEANSIFPPSDTTPESSSAPSSSLDEVLLSIRGREFGLLLVPWKVNPGAVNSSKSLATSFSPNSSSEEESSSSDPPYLPQLPSVPPYRYAEKSVNDHSMSRCYRDVNKTNKAARL